MILCMGVGGCLLCRAYRPWLPSILMKIPVGSASISSPDQTWSTVNLHVLALDGREGGPPRAPETMEAPRESLAEGNHILAPAHPPFSAPADRWGTVSGQDRCTLFAHSCCVTLQGHGENTATKPFPVPSAPYWNDLWKGSKLYPQCLMTVEKRTAEELENTHVPQIHPQLPPGFCSNAK